MPGPRHAAIVPGRRPALLRLAEETHRVLRLFPAAPSAGIQPHADGSASGLRDASLGATRIRQTLPKSALRQAVTHQ